MSSDEPKTQLKSTRDRLTEAMIRVIGSEGMHAASVRTIAREAQCNEAVLYQHFPSKSAMQEAIYEEIVSEMAEEKRLLVQTATDLSEFLSMWVEVTYRNYDRRPDAFAYALLTFPPVMRMENPISDIQTRLFNEALQSLKPPAGFRARSDSVTITSFRSILLGIPNEIHMKLLKGPAISYAKEISRLAELIIFEPC